MSQSLQTKLAVITLVVFQVLLTCAALRPVYFPIMIGTGDAQIVLAVTIAVFSNVRWSLRGPIVGLLVLTACAIHYVCWVNLAYPYIFAEQYFTPLLLAFSLWVTLAMFHRFQRLDKAGHDGNAFRSSAASRIRFSLIDMLVWPLLVGLLIAIGNRAVALTDVSGMYDPWETIEFALVGAPEFVVWRMPLLLAALLLHAGAWTTIVRLTLTERVGWKSAALALVSFVALTLGEVVVSCGTLLFDKPWPILPTSMLPAVGFASRLQLMLERHSELDAASEVMELALILTTRVVLLSCSLLLLRYCGMRLRVRASEIVQA